MPKRSAARIAREGYTVVTRPRDVDLSAKDEQELAGRFVKSWERARTERAFAAFQRRSAQPDHDRAGHLPEFDDEDDLDDLEQRNEPGVARWLDTALTTYKERLQRTQHAWSAIKPALIEKTVQYAPFNAARRCHSRLTTSTVIMMQQHDACLQLCKPESVRTLTEVSSMLLCDAKPTIAFLCTGSRKESGGSQIRRP